MILPEGKKTNTEKKKKELQRKLLSFATSFSAFPPKTHCSCTSAEAEDQNVGDKLPLGMNM